MSHHAKTLRAAQKLRQYAEEINSGQPVTHTADDCAVTELRGAATMLEAFAISLDAHETKEGPSDG